MSGREDMDPAYAETLAGKSEELRHAVKNFFLAFLHDLESLLVEKPQASPVDVDCLPPLADGDASSLGVRIRLRCAAGEGGCVDWPEQHDHIVYFPTNDRRSDQRDGTALRLTNDDREPISCARGEPCPTGTQCRCTCEHYHRPERDAFYQPRWGGAISRNGPRGELVPKLVGDFYCPIHGNRNSVVSK